MKTLYFFFACLFLSQVVYSQDQRDNIERKGLVRKEKNAYAKRMEAGSINPNTLNYDLKYQRMDLTLTPGSYNISGSVTSHFKAKQDMNNIYFDLTDTLRVSQVNYHGSNIPFQQLANKELKIDFPVTIPSNTLDSLTVHYSGGVRNDGVFFNTYAQSPMDSIALSTLNEPYGAQDWFPTKQSLNDKIDRFDFKITTPAGYSVAANGKLMSETALPGGQKLTFWRTMHPTAAYLVGLSITNFVKQSSTIGNPPFPFINYVYPSTAANTRIMNNIEWTKQIMNTFETYFGLYPFRDEKYGHMEFTWGGGMEHQTMSSMGSWSKGIIAHELAHQWFGDKVTCGTWNDVWLNEGFAAFGEHLANEKLLMTNTEFLNYLAGEKNYVTSSSGGSTYVHDVLTTDIFSSRLTYSKGGYIVRMIKWILGDDVFYQALKDYLSRPDLAYGYAATADLKASLLQSTGKDFTEFFNDWLYGEGYPAYVTLWKQTDNQIHFKIYQTQSSPTVSFFEMPLPIKVVGTAGETAYFVLNNTTNIQDFVKTVSFPVAKVEFNYEHQILERNSIVIQDNTLSLSSVEKEKFSLYPNPAKNELFIKGIDRTTDFSIHTADGRLVKKGMYQPEKTVNISDLVPGIYIFTIQGKPVKFIKR